MGDVNKIYLVMYAVVCVCVYASVCGRRLRSL